MLNQIGKRLWVVLACLNLGETRIASSRIAEALNGGSICMECVYISDTEDLFNQMTHLSTVPPWHFTEETVTNAIWLIVLPIVAPMSVYIGKSISILHFLQIFMKTNFSCC